jgi:hypothetical protein
MVGEILAGLQGFNAIMNGAKALAQMHDDSVRLQASIDLQRQVFDAQQDYAALLERLEQLKAKVMTFENWQTEKQRYQPRQFEPEVTVYLLKPGENGAELGQHFCPSCYQNKKASILHVTDRTSGSRPVRICLECKVELPYGPKEPDPIIRRSHGSWMSS